MTLAEIQQQALARGLGNVKRLVSQATRLRKGWELDNEVWMVQMDDDSMCMLSTNHGGLTDYSIEELQEAVAETLNSLKSLMNLELQMKYGVLHPTPFIIK